VEGDKGVVGPCSEPTTPCSSELAASLAPAEKDARQKYGNPHPDAEEDLRAHGMGVETEVIEEVAGPLGRLVSDGLDLRHDRAIHSLQFHSPWVVVTLLPVGQSNCCPGIITSLTISLPKLCFWCFTRSLYFLPAAIRWQ